jgi:class 3 adenylate cyclase
MAGLAGFAFSLPAQEPKRALGSTLMSPQRDLEPLDKAVSAERLREIANRASRPPVRMIGSRSADYITASGHGAAQTGRTHDLHPTASRTSDSPCNAGVAQLIHSRLADMNRTLADELPEPIAIGVGLHAGNVILGELGYRDRFLLTAIGDPVHVAARLQELTKDYDCQLVVSDIVATTAGVEMSGFPVREVNVRGRAEPLVVRIVGAMNELVA